MRARGTERNALINGADEPSRDLSIRDLVVEEAETPRQAGAGVGYDWDDNTTRRWVDSARAQRDSRRGLLRKVSTWEVVCNRNLLQAQQMRLRRTSRW